MKKVSVLLILCLSIFTACKNDSKQTETSTINTNSSEKTAKQNDGLTLLSGEFIYYADAAVLQVGNNVYGVVLNEKTKELNKKAQAYRKEATDGVHVQVRGKIIPKTENEEGWPFKVDIKEIESVKALDAKQNEVIKIGK
ncbi:hypothetical protein [Lacinutrix chionoecetis]